MAQVRLTQLRKAYDHRKDVLTGIDLDIAHGEFVVLLGPSGCGKTTLLRLLCGLERATEGRIELDGQCIDHLPPAERGMAMVFQNYALYPHMSVYDNLSFGLRMMGTPRAEVAARVGRAAAILKIDTLLDRRPAQLSGGQRQRVAIGRAIVREPQLFLFDEPLSNLDASLRARTRLEIARLHRQLGATIVYVTHDQVEAMLLGDRIVVLHEGRIQQSGTPLQLYHEPCNLFVAGFIGTPKMNFLPAHVVTAGHNGMTLRLGDGHLIRAAVDGAGQLPGASVTLGLRAEQVLPAGEGSEVLNGRVLDAKCLGDATLLYLQLGADTELVVRCPGNLRASFDDLLSFSAEPHAFHVFDSHGQAMHRLQRDWNRTAGPALTALVA